MGESEEDPFACVQKQIWPPCAADPVSEPVTPGTPAADYEQLPLPPVTDPTTPGTPEDEVQVLRVEDVYTSSEAGKIRNQCFPGKACKLCPTAGDETSGDEVQERPTRKL